MPIPFILDKFQVNTITNIEVMRQIVFNHARVTVIGVGIGLELRNFK